MSLTGHLVVYNCEKIKYPWRESIRSLLPAVEEMIVMDCGSDDGTLEALKGLQAAYPAIRLLQGAWGDKSDVVGQRVNDCIDAVRTDYHVQIQADEVMHEDSLAHLKAFPSLMDEQHVKAAHVRYRHFVSNYRTVFPFIYDRTIRIAKRWSSWRSTGDGMQFAGLGPTLTSMVEFYHYGKVHVGREREALIKEWEFQQLFVHLNIGFPDPNVKAALSDGQLDYDKIFALSKRWFKPFSGTHPAVMERWIAQAEGRQ